MLNQLVKGCLLLCVLGFSAKAQEQISTGGAVICDTIPQVERFLAVFENDLVTAVEQVNAEAKSPNACGYAYIAFARGAEVAEGRSAQGPYKVVEVLIVGSFDGQAWHRTVPMRQYTAINGRPERGT